jgi:hypothetical protein
MNKILKFFEEYQKQYFRWVVNILKNGVIWKRVMVVLLFQLLTVDELICSTEYSGLKL